MTNIVTEAANDPKLKKAVKEYIDKNSIKKNMRNM
jgi:hypothetical protein